MEQYVGEGQDVRQGCPCDGETSSPTAQDESCSPGLAHGGVYYVLVTSLEFVSTWLPF